MATILGILLAVSPFIVLVIVFGFIAVYGPDIANTVSVRRSVRHAKRRAAKLAR